MSKPCVGLPILACLLPVLAAVGGESRLFGQGRKIVAAEHRRTTIYHSPETPGFTCWTGTWIMPDASLMVCFTQATGPLKGRPRVPEEISRKLAWPPAGNPHYDMTGLDMRNVHLRSFDSGKSWQQVSADPFRSCMNGCTGQCETALAGGTVIRGVWGHYLPYDPSIPKTGYLHPVLPAERTGRGRPHLHLRPRGRRQPVWQRGPVDRDGRVSPGRTVSWSPTGVARRRKKAGPRSLATGAEDASNGRGAIFR